MFQYVSRITTFAALSAAPYCIEHRNLYIWIRHFITLHDIEPVLDHGDRTKRSGSQTRVRQIHVLYRFDRIPCAVSGSPVKVNWDFCFSNVLIGNGGLDYRVVCKSRLGSSSAFLLWQWKLLIAQQILRRI